MRTLPLADARILAPVVSFLECNGARAETYLDRLSIPGEMIESGGMIAKQQCHDILLQVAQRERCEQVGFAAYLALQLGDLGPIGAAMESAKTAREALAVFTRMASNAYEGNEYFIESDGATTWLCFRDRDFTSVGYVYSHHVTMMSYRQMVRHLTARPWRPQVMKCHGADLDSHLHVEAFEECRVSYHADHSALAVPTELLSRPLSAPASGSRVPNDSESSFAIDTAPKTFVGSLQQFIEARFQYGKLPTLEHVASMIGFSMRSIQYCLQEEGLSYRRLLDRICYDAAIEMLRDTQ